MTKKDLGYDATKKKKESAMKLSISLIVALISLFAMGYIEKSCIAMKKAMFDYMNDKPYDAEVEYIATTGSQYIKTGIIPNGFDVFEFTAAILNGSDSAIFEIDTGRTGVNGIGVTSHNNLVVFSYYNGYSLTQLDCRQKHTYIIECGRLYVEDVLAVDRGINEIQSNLELWLFAWNRNGNTLQFPGEVRLYSFRHNEDIDLIPVRFTNEDGVIEGAMYDKVSGKLFRNDGEGKFILGPDL